MTTASIDEPVPALEAGAGSSSSENPITPGRDALRVLSCALLVAASVASPGSALLLAPFVPAIVALRLVRQRAGSRAFVVASTIASVLAAVAAAMQHEAYLLAGVAAILLVPALGMVHAVASRHDPIESAEQPAWPEPRLGSGLTPTIGAWIVAILVLVGLAAPRVDSPTAAGKDLVRDAYSFYTRECGDGGIFESRKAYCEEALAQRDMAIELVTDHLSELLGGLVAIIVFGAATTAHMVVLARGRRSSDRVRRSWRLRELELHWSMAYVLALGLVLMMVAGDTGGLAAAITRGFGVGCAVLAALAITTQGIGLVAWMFSRGGAPTWYRVALAAFALFVLPVTLTLLFFLGVLDMAIHSRRRAAKSGNLPGRGSGS